MQILRKAKQENFIQCKINFLYGNDKLIVSLHR